MNKETNRELKKIIGRLLTSLLFWVIFALYFQIKGQSIEVVETLVLFGACAVFMPYVVGFWYDTLK